MAMNPALNRIEQDSRRGYAGFDDQPRHGEYAPAPGSDAGGGGLDHRGLNPAGRPDRVTIDDVFMKTFGLFAIMLIVAAASWILVGAQPQWGTPVWLLGMFGSLALSFGISMMRSVNVPLILVHAVLQGAFIGAISVSYEAASNGIVVAAATATLATFVAMFLGWKVGLIKVTSRSRRIFGLIALGYLAFLLINLALAWTGVFNIYATSFGWLFGLFGVGMASYSLAISFDTVERGIQAGAPEKYSWMMAHGILGSVVWLYIEFLRLFGSLRA